MLIRGEWLLCDDGVSRPVIHAEVQAPDGTWVKAPFLLDTGADQTVLSADRVQALNLRPGLVSDSRTLGGLGSDVRASVIETYLRLTQDAGGKVLFRGRYAGLSDPAELDMSVLGRDVTNLFTIIVVRPGNFVGLLRDRHAYRVEQA